MSKRTGLEKPGMLHKNSTMVKNHAYPQEVRAMLAEALRHACTGKGNSQVLQHIAKEADRIRKRVLKKHGVVDIGVPAIRALRTGHE
jgi:hypothetical protein